MFTDFKNINCRLLRSLLYFKIFTWEPAILSISSIYIRTFHIAVNWNPILKPSNKSSQPTTISSSKVSGKDQWASQSEKFQRVIDRYSNFENFKSRLTCSLILNILNFNWLASPFYEFQNFLWEFANQFVDFINL